MGKPAPVAADKKNGFEVLLSVMDREKRAAFIEERAIKPLTTDDKKEILKSLRYPFMTHEQLLDLLGKPGFEDARDFIREGISFKLSSYEHKTDGVKFHIDTRPRNKYFIPDLAIADLENEIFDAKNPAQDKAIRAQRQKLKEAALALLTEEQKEVMRYYKSTGNRNAYLTEKQIDYERKLDEQIHKKSEMLAKQQQ